MLTVDIQGANVPSIAMGTFMVPDKEAATQVATALEYGYRHIDTAQMYGNEDGVGRGIADSGVPRDAIFLTTKVDNEQRDSEAVVTSVEASLSRLRTEYIDLLLVHWPVDFHRMEDVLTAMAELRERGHVLHVGVSNFTTPQLEAALDYAPVFCNQVEYHPHLDQTKLLETCRTHDVLLAAHTPLARGRILEDGAIREIAEAHECTPAQVVIRWLVDQDHVAAITKTVTPERMRENLDVERVSLSDDDRARLAAAPKDHRIVDPPFAPEWDDGA